MNTKTKYILKLESGHYFSWQTVKEAADAAPLDLETATELRDDQELVANGRFDCHAPVTYRDVSPQVDQIIPVEVKDQFIVEIDGEQTASAARLQKGVEG